MINKYITVLDFETGQVFQYNLEEFGDNYIFIDKDLPQNEEVEDVLTDIGHNLNNIEWMSHDNPHIFTNKDIITN